MVFYVCTVMAKKRKTTSLVITKEVVLRFLATTTRMPKNLFHVKSVNQENSAIYLCTV